MKTIINLSSKNYGELTYISDEKRDLMLICPGGGYEYTSLREAEVVAIKFREKGFHTLTYYYRESKLLYPETSIEAYELLNKLKKISNIGRIFICGFSAGGHFALQSLIKYKNLFSGAILAYPVVSNDPDSIHQGSFDKLLGKNLQYWDEVSLEKQITRKLPPIFIWHTKSDQAVPVSNAYKLVSKLEKTKTIHELLLFENGPHGLSLATKETSFESMDPLEFERTYKEISSWFEKAVTFIKKI